MAKASFQRSRSRGLKAAPAAAAKPKLFDFSDFGLPITPSVRVWLGVGVIFAATIVAYIPALRAGYIWDDDWLVTMNPRLRTGQGLSKIWSPLNKEMPDYLPLTWTSLWVQRQVGRRLDPTDPGAPPRPLAWWQLQADTAWPYHLVNILLHIGSALLVWMLLKELKAPGAWLAGLVFAVHPVNVASVAWVVERKNTLSMVFFLLMTLAYLWHLRTGRWGWYGGAVALFAVALLSKVSVVMAPLALLGLTWYAMRRLNRWDLLRSLPFFLLSAAAAGMTVWTQTVRVIQTETVFAPSETIFWRLAGAGWSVWFYIYKVLWPAKLAMIYPRWQVDPLVMRDWLGLVAVAAGLAALGWYRNRRYVRPAAMAMGYYVLMLVPVMGFFKMFYMRFSLAADHWQYLSIISLIALVVGSLWRLAQRGGQGAKTALAVVAVAAVAAMGVQTFRQCRVYKDQLTLWQDNLDKYDKTWMAWFSLGNSWSSQYDQTGDPKALQEAYHDYQRAVELKPDFHMARNNLGNLMAKEGKFAEALACYTQALAYKGDARLSNNRGAMLWQLGRPTEGLAAVRQALEYQAEYTPARLNLAEFLIRIGRQDEAITELRRGIELDPYDPDLHVKLGSMLLQRHQMDQGVEETNRALELQPKHVGALQNLGVALVQQGRFDQALEKYDRALALQPANAEVLLNRAFALAKLKRFTEAVGVYEQALSAEPDMKEALKSLAWMRATCPDAAVRDGAKALEAARRLDDLTGHQMADVLDVLAAAYAQAGDFAQARQTVQQAVAIARRINMPQLAQEIAQRADLYAASQPYRQP